MQKNLLRERQRPFKGRKQPKREHNPTFEKGLGRCPTCGLKYDTNLMKVRDFSGFPICPKCKVPLKAVRIKNPGYAYGPTGSRPPKQWWDKMVAIAKYGYRKWKGQSDESYNAALARIVGGIWSRFSDATRQRILKKYEGITNPQPDNNGRHNQLECPVCELPNPMSPGISTAKCRGCGYKLKRVSVKKA